MYKAHKNEITGEIQSVKEHSINTANLCREFAVPVLKDMLYNLGLLHDVGKYQISFQKRINGSNIRVEHSTSGAKVVKEKYSNGVALMMEYCIIGHHSGIPDAGTISDTPDMTTLYGRIKRQCENYDDYKKELEILPMDNNDIIRYLSCDCKNKFELIDKYAFFTRYCFSCLTDADSLDTAKFCRGPENRSLHTNFYKCLDQINKSFTGFVCNTELQKARSKIQGQVYKKVGHDAGIYLMNMPTGSGKTLCSAKFALEEAIIKKKKRIIYVIPYNSIIEQTAEVFESVFGENAEILRHQSTFSYEDKDGYSEDYRITIKNATENWDAQIIVTTAVQFFESIYANKRGKLRKLHNMADSVLVFDEVHLMPIDFLQPCLEAIVYITSYLNSEAVFLTATMPDFEKLIKKYTLRGSKIENLVEDTSLFYLFDKCNYKDLGYLSDEKLITISLESASSLIVVNKKKTARRLYELCRGKKFHLSTYMTAFDRMKTIASIKNELQNLEKNFPNMKNVPENSRVTVISTSLIEAGVDLDFCAVFRELSGLDNILQTGGRCNREGKLKNATTYIFQLESEKNKISNDIRANITKGLIKKYENISCADCIREYYDMLFFSQEDRITNMAMYQECTDILSIPFQSYANKFELIDSKTVSIVVERNRTSSDLIKELEDTGKTDVRKLQMYTCTIYQQEFDDLLTQHVINDFGSGIWCLMNSDYYDIETGILFEGKDCFI